MSRPPKSESCRSSSRSAPTVKKNPLILDTHRYQARHLVENLSQHLKVFRRVAAHYDKFDVTFLGFVHIACTMMLLH